MHKLILSTTIFFTSVLVIAVCGTADVLPKVVVDRPQMNSRPMINHVSSDLLLWKSLSFTYGRDHRKQKLAIVQCVDIHIPQVSDDEVDKTILSPMTLPEAQYRTLRAPDNILPNVYPDVYSVSHRYLERLVISCSITSCYGLMIPSVFRIRCYCVRMHSYCILPPFQPPLPIIGPIVDPFTKTPIIRYYY